MSRRPRLLAVGAAVAAAIVVRLARQELNEPPDRTGAGIPLPAEPRTRGGIGDARVVVPGVEPEWVRDLASWVPPAPTTPWGRALAYVWASPSTIAGLLLGALSGAAPTWGDGVVVFAGVRGPIRALMRRVGYSATTMGHVVLARRTPSQALMAHELVHTRQAERLGPLMGPVYWYLLLRYGYARHPMERAARIAGRSAKHALAGHTRPTRVPVRR